MISIDELIRASESAHSSGVPVDWRLVAYQISQAGSLRIQELEAMIPKDNEGPEEAGE